MSDILNYLVELEQNWVNYYKCLIIIEMSSFYSGCIDEDAMLASCGIPVPKIIEERTEKLSIIKDKLPISIINKITASDIYEYFNNIEYKICEKIRNECDRNFTYERQPENVKIAVKQLIEQIGDQMNDPEVRIGKDFHVYMLVFRDLVSRLNSYS